MIEAVQKRTITGRVTSAKQPMTRTITVEWSRIHKMYGKVQRRKTTYYAHDELNLSKEGDLVEIVEVAPISKTKNWRIIKVVEQAK